MVLVKTNTPISALTAAIVPAMLRLKKKVSIFILPFQEIGWFGFCIHTVLETALTAHTLASLQTQNYRPILMSMTIFHVHWKTRQDGSFLPVPNHIFF